MLVSNPGDPLLQSQAAELLRQWNDTRLRGEIFPTAHDQCLPEPPPFAASIQPEMQILQQKDRVTITYIAGPTVRHIRLNSRHLGRVTPSWTGDSIGHYDGDTLVIDTVGIKAPTLAAIEWLGAPFSPALHVIERYRLIDAVTAKQAMDAQAKIMRASPELFYGVAVDPNFRGGGLQLDFMVDDPGSFTSSWSGKASYGHPMADFAEAICAENAVSSYWGKPTLIPVADKPDF